MSRSKMFKHMTVGAILGSVLFSGVSYAATQTNITVNFLPLKYYFDGVQKQAPDGQQGFIYQGTTYVPIRFVSEALGKKVGYDGKTTSIYVGKQKAGTVTYLEQLKTITTDSESVHGYPYSDFTTNRGDVYSRNWSVGSQGYGLDDGYFIDEYILDGEYKEFDVLLAPQDFWTNLPKEPNIGSLRVYADEVLVYDSGAIASDLTAPLAVNVDLTGALRVKFEVRGTGLGFLDARLTS